MNRRLGSLLLGIVMMFSLVGASAPPANAQVVVRVGPRHPHRRYYHHRHYRRPYYRHGRRYYR